MLVFLLLEFHNFSFLIDITENIFDTVELIFLNTYTSLGVRP